MRDDAIAGPVPWREWVTARGAWAPDLNPDGTMVAYVSDRSGLPRAWVQPVDADGGPARQLPTGDDHVYDLSFSPDGRYVAVLAAPGGRATRTRVWIACVDGSGSRRVAGVRQGTATFGPWLRTAPVLALATTGRRPEETTSNLLDVETGAIQPIAYGTPLTVVDISHDGTCGLVRSGARGERHLVVVPLGGGPTTNLLKPDRPGEGGAEAGVFAPDGTVYARSDRDRERSALVAVDPQSGEVREVAARDDAELDLFTVSDCGRRALLAWNVADGCSQVELLDLETGAVVPVPVPAPVVERVRFSRDARCVVVAGEGPDAPRGVWVGRIDEPDDGWPSAPGQDGSAAPAPRTTLGQLSRADRPYRPLGERSRVVHPRRETVTTPDGLRITGWLYEPPDRDRPGPATLWLHGGPEAQERPGFQPLFQSLLDAGIAVWAPNVRGSTGYGRGFEHADDVGLRPDAIADVALCGRHLIATGIAEPGNLGVAGRSYGGYLTLAALAFHPELFVAGVDVCGMSDLVTFFQHTEPWIAAVSASKYGHPVHDRALLDSVSPLRHADAIIAPLLVVHGRNDRNVPVRESDQIVAALRDRGRVVDYLLVDDEGHDFGRPSSRLRFVERATGWLGQHLRQRVAEVA